MESGLYIFYNILEYVQISHYYVLLLNEKNLYWVWTFKKILEYVQISHYYVFLLNEK